MTLNEIKREVKASLSPVEFDELCSWVMRERAEAPPIWAEQASRLASKLAVKWYSQAEVDRVLAVAEDDSDPADVE